MYPMVVVIIAMFIATSLTTENKFIIIGINSLGGLRLMLSLYLLTSFP